MVSGLIRSRRQFHNFFSEMDHHITVMGYRDTVFGTSLLVSPTRHVELFFQGGCVVASLAGGVAPHRAKWSEIIKWAGR